MDEVNRVLNGRPAEYDDLQQLVYTRAMFEVLNDGSEFNISGGTLIIENGGCSTAYYGDILIAPASYSVTGGTLQIGSGSTSSNTITLSASAPLWNLTVDGTSSNKFLDLRVNNLEIRNNLTINGNSEFRANGLDVSIGGNLTNNNSNAGTGISNGGFQAGAFTQATTLIGDGNQEIYGNGTNLTNFANLVVESSGTITLHVNSNIRINGDFTFNQGTIADGSNDITVTGLI